jgi:putative ABC transport system permease protein
MKNLLTPRADRDRASQFRLQDSLFEAAAAVAQRPIRTLLTALGTILGVGAFVATTGLVQTAQAQVSARFDALKATEVRIEDAAPDGANPFPDDVDSRLEGLNGVRFAGLSFRIPDSGTIEPREMASRPMTASQPISLLAATPGAIQASIPVIASGRLFDDFHEKAHQRVALLGEVTARRLGIASVDNQPIIFLGDNAYSVVGILENVKRNPDMLLSVIIPVSTATQDFNVASVEREVLIDTQPGAAELAGSQAPIALRPQDPARLRVLVPPDPTTLRTKVESDVTSLFYALSGLALLIGTIAIANATLLNIVERRPEIGLRRALGATRSHITRQITLEASVVGTLAGTLGTTLGILTITVAATARNWQPTLQPGTLAVAPVIGIVTGAVAGLIPAWKASHTPPAETLRQ